MDEYIIIKEKILNLKYKQYTNMDEMRIQMDVMMKQLKLQQ